MRFPFLTTFAIIPSFAASSLAVSSLAIFSLAIYSLALPCFAQENATNTNIKTTAKKSKDETANTEFAKNIIGKADGWTVLKANPQGNTVCYAILYAQARRGNQTTQEEQPYIMVHYFAENKLRFSAYFGYKLIEAQPVHLSIDSIQHKISSINEYAITQSAEQDEDIVEKLKKGTTLLIRGEGTNYTYSVDTYSLQGFGQAFTIMQENCDSNANNTAFKTIIPERKDLRKNQNQPAKN